MAWDGRRGDGGAKVDGHEERLVEGRKLLDGPVAENLDGLVGKIGGGDGIAIPQPGHPIQKLDLVFIKRVQGCKDLVRDCHAYIIHQN